MRDMETLMNKIMGLCKCEFSITVNEHRNNYMSVEEYFTRVMNEEDIEADIFNRMVQDKTIVCVSCYSRTPVGFYSVYHYDVTAALEEMLEILQ